MKYDKDKINDHMRVTAMSILHADISSGEFRTSISNRSAIDQAFKQVKQQAAVFGVELNPEDIDNDFLNKHLDDARVWI